MSRLAPADRPRKVHRNNVSLPTLSIGLPRWCLRAWREADAPSLVQHANDFEVWRHMGDRFPRLHTLEVAQQWVTRGHIDFGGENWAMTLDDLAVGGCGLHRGAGEFGCGVEVGYWLGRPYWGRGVASRVVRALSERALATAGVERVFAGVHADNPASMRVLEKNGFEREGVLRRSVLKAGVAIDRVIYARIRG